jgi:4-nitrophenol 2-monooxygenase / 4-nitrocatechol 4-monooxygenase, reductase component
MMSADVFREIVGHFASGVTVVTTRHDRRPYGATASAFTSLSLEPPMVLLCMSRSSGTGEAIRACRRFGVNILSEEQLDAAVRFARKGAEKFAGVRLSAGESDVPLLEDALATLECRVVEEIVGGTHWVFLAAVEHGTARSGTPLAYWRGQFGRLDLAAQPAGRDRV